MRSVGPEGIERRKGRWEGSFVCWRQGETSCVERISEMHAVAYIFLLLVFVAFLFLY